MSPTAPAVPFSHLLAMVFFKKCNSLKKKSRVGCNWCVLCCRIKHESILSLCELWTLFKGFNQKKNPIKKKTLTLGRWTRKCSNACFRLQSDIIVDSGGTNISVFITEVGGSVLDIWAFQRSRRSVCVHTV